MANSALSASVERVSPNQFQPFSYDPGFDEKALKSKRQTTAVAEQPHKERAT